MPQDACGDRLPERFVTGHVLGVIAALATAGLTAISSPAGALTNQCAVGMWPDLPAGQSALKAACSDTPSRRVRIH